MINAYEPSLDIRTWVNLGCHGQKQFPSASPALAVQDCIQETALRNITQSIILSVLAEINGL